MSTEYRCSHCWTVSTGKDLGGELGCPVCGSPSIMEIKPNIQQPDPIRAFSKDFKTFPSINWDEIRQKQRDEANWATAEKQSAIQPPKTLGDLLQDEYFPDAKPETVKQGNPKDAIGDTKMPMHLVSGVVKLYQALAHFLGNVKYGAWNYRAEGARASVYRAALDRHMDAWWEGEENDPDDGTPHLANAICCINILIEAKEAKKLIDDRPPSSNYREVSKRLTPLVAQIKEKYKDRKPVHYTIETKGD